jgi:hypothetical protein
MKRYVAKAQTAIAQSNLLPINDECFKPRLDSRIDIPGHEVQFQEKVHHNLRESIIRSLCISNS